MSAAKLMSSKLENGVSVRMLRGEDRRDGSKA